MNAPEPTIHITETELYRLNVAYMLIENPNIRAEFLTLVEAWAQE